MSDENGFQLYKLLIEEIREVRAARRAQSNIFTTLNLGGVGALGFLWTQNTVEAPALMLWLTGALVLTSLVWRQSNAYYRKLLNIKFEVLYEQEAALGLSAIRSEYERMKARGLRGVMKFFRLEGAMPWLFMIGYVVMAAYVFRGPIAAALGVDLDALTPAVLVPSP